MFIHEKTAMQVEMGLLTTVWQRAHIHFSLIAEYSHFLLVTQTIAVFYRQLLSAYTIVCLCITIVYS